MNSGYYATRDFLLFLDGNLLSTVVSKVEILLYGQVSSWEGWESREMFPFLQLQLVTNLTSVKGRVLGVVG